MPHVIEKLIMLKNGTLTRSIDIFDLFYQLVPTIVILLKCLQGLFEIGRYAPDFERDHIMALKMGLGGDWWNTVQMDGMEFWVEIGVESE